MKKKDLTNLRKKEIKDLEKMAKDMKLELAKATAEMRASREKNLKKTKNLRHDVAQILTIVREKELMERESRTSSTGKVDRKPVIPRKAKTQRGKQRVQRSPQKTQRKSQ
jgi:ribosomal protein L29